jgi:hypothetical protein
MPGRVSRPGIIAFGYHDRRGTARRQPAAEEITMHRGMHTLVMTLGVGAGAILLVLILLWLK